MKRRQLTCVGIMALGMFLGGCEGDNGTPLSAGAVDVSGVWDAVAADVGDSGTLSLTQRGSSVSGRFVTSSGYSGAVSGTADDDRFTVTLSYASGESVLSAAVDGRSMSGTYRASSGQSGTFTGTAR